jgi:hypothetical protein
MTTPPAGSSPNTLARSCDICGAVAATKYSEFYENIGALVMRYYRSVRGNLCKGCIDAFFWNYTGKTMLLGWWGVISFIVTPFILLNNSIRYLTSLGMSRPFARFGPVPSPLWTFTTMAGFVLVGFIGTSLFVIPPTPEPFRPVSASAASPSLPAALPTPFRPRPTTTPSCIPWSAVTRQHLGKTICVYGYVNEVYTRSPFATVIRFGTDPSEFFMVDGEYTYPEVGQGACVQAIAPVKSLDDRLFQDVAGELLKCD